jgi:4-hydroxybenzoate polyprenyltransferase
MAASQQAGAASRVVPTAGATTATAVPLVDLLRALSASTLHRMRMGEGVLLAINVSLAWQRAAAFGDLVATSIVSTLTLGLMYAFNDAYDAAGDRHNPKKDQRVVSTYLDHALASYTAIFLGKALTLVVAYLACSPLVAVAVAVSFAVNLVYSTMLKGVPVVDVAWCGVWGAAYAAIAQPTLQLLLLVGVMTAICHLYQALGDRSADAENRITTTAVFSRGLSIGVLFALSSLLVPLLVGPLGPVGACSAFVPFALLFLVKDSHTAWLATKAYFGIAWVFVLEQLRAVV